MDGEAGDWMAYIEREVTALCHTKGWGHQIRRKWSVREKPMAESVIDDYEWKFIPGTHGKLPDARDFDFEGTYYVLSFDQVKRRFVFQHDTSHCGVMGPRWEEATYTEIWIGPFAGNLRPPSEDAPMHPAALLERPPVGWLCDHLNGLTTRFAPNCFSLT